MRKVCKMLKKQTEPNFLNLETAIRTYDRDVLICGAPAWRYVYHTIHSADKWFFDPFVYEEPPFHEEGMDNPDNPCTAVLSDEELLRYLQKVRDKTMTYLDSLCDADLNERPENCPYTRLELILMQFRHISYHAGMLCGITIEKTGKFPVYVNADTVDRLEKGLYDE